jgi:ATPase, YjeE family
MVFYSEDETFNWASEFGKSLQPGDRVALYGNLGAGKTVISRGVCKGLGYTGTVCSPTYTILHEYPNDPPIFHFDLYRLEGAPTCTKSAWIRTTWHRASALSNGPNA